MEMVYIGLLSRPPMHNKQSQVSEASGSINEWDHRTSAEPIKCVYRDIFILPDFNVEKLAHSNKIYLIQEIQRIPLYPPTYERK